MGNFRKNRENRFSGGRGGGFGRRDEGRSDFRKNWSRGGGDRGPVTMHQAVCAECGSACEVPFRPVEGKPVYCSNCFRAKKGGGERFVQREFSADRAPVRNDFAANASNQSLEEMKKQFQMLNSRIDQIFNAIHALSGQKDTAVTAEKEKTKEKVKEAVKKTPTAKAKKVAKKAPKK